MTETLQPETERHTRTPAVLAWLRMMRIHHKLERALEEGARREGLSFAQFDILAHVGAAEGMTQQQLADALLVTKGNVCQLLDRMEASGLLLRRQCGRANRLYLTERGRDTFGRVVPDHEQCIVELFQGLSPDEQDQLHRLLQRLDRSLD